MVDDANSNDWLIGSHKDSAEYKAMLEKHSKPQIHTHEEADIVTRRDFRIALYRVSDEKFVASEKLDSGELYLLRAIFSKDDQRVLKDAYRIIADPGENADFRMAVIKECEKREMLEVIVLASRERLPDRLQSAAERAKVAIMMSFGHAGKVNQEDKFAVRSSVANKMKQI